MLDLAHCMKQDWYPSSLHNQIYSQWVHYWRSERIIPNFRTFPPIIWIPKIYIKTLQQLLRQKKKYPRVIKHESAGAGFLAWPWARHSYFKNKALKYRSPKEEEEGGGDLCPFGEGEWIWSIYKKNQKGLAHKLRPRGRCRAAAYESGTLLCKVFYYPSLLEVSCTVASTDIIEWCKNEDICYSMLTTTVYIHRSHVSEMFLQTFLSSMYSISRYMYVALLKTPKLMIRKLHSLIGHLLMLCLFTVVEKHLGNEWVGGWM